MSELESADATRRCRPTRSCRLTNPLTIKAYKDDPELQNRLLSEARDLRRSVKANALAQILGLLGSDVADLLGGLNAFAKPPWLGPVTGALSAFAADNFDQANEANISALERSVVKCDPQPSPGASGVGGVCTESPDPGQPAVPSSGGVCANPSGPAAAPGHYRIDLTNSGPASYLIFPGHYEGDADIQCSRGSGGLWQVGAFLADKVSNDADVFAFSIGEYANGASVVEVNPSNDGFAWAIFGGHNGATVTVRVSAQPGTATADAAGTDGKKAIRISVTCSAVLGGETP